MNLTDFMQGKLTKSGCYALIASGLYSMAIDVGQLLQPPADYAFALHGIMSSEGFKLFMAGWILYGLRRAMMKGGAEKPQPTEEEVAAKMAELKETVTAAAAVLAKFQEKAK